MHSEGELDPQLLCARGFLSILCLEAMGEHDALAFLKWLEEPEPESILALVGRGADVLKELLPHVALATPSWLEVHTTSEARIAAVKGASVLYVHRKPPPFPCDVLRFHLPGRRVVWIRKLIELAPRC